MIENSSLVDLTVTSSTTHVLTGVVNDIDVLLEVHTGHDDTTSERSPLNLSIVLDRSGSMDGEKLVNAKSAIIGVIESLEKDDILHLVCYGSKIETICQNADIQKDRLELIKKVKEIVTEGYTNLWGGVECGAKLLTEHRKNGYNSRLFLFSDGLVNEGVKDKELIKKNVSDIYTNEGIQISAFGLGTDFDEELMRGIADNGNGAYFFIAGPETISSFVDFALKSILKMVGTEAVLKVRGVDKGLLKKFYGNHDVVKGAILGDLRADNVRSVLAQLEVRGDVEKKTKKEVLHCELEFKKMGQSEIVKIQRTLVLKFTDDPKKVENSVNARVKVKVVVQKTAEIDKELLKLMNSGKNTKKAINLQEEQIKLLEEIVELDNTVLGGENKIEALLKQAKKSLEKLKLAGVTKEAQKEVHHRGYVKSRG